MQSLACTAHATPRPIIHKPVHHNDKTVVYESSP